ncbi:hypothetical protein [Piscinibacter gummiphilus]|uniref:Uncharacterized protein n=1 Tax=Piscinibacter gummiphilus TaxID=946333 RepID=A0A1W6L2J5_9BURK|nr:hypothetical protein [Piscinibacter gummiphilus]ARN18437.1 hypothetical protein A4W93_00055 [Piscinibacter gummiphilus]ATU63066.1 hypothetical protein CPZ87_00060 [Piscinibacter gummiphilus]GLS98272.1 hypothetical protein GCM10007918_55640 [Piscinibacter gummiphilus]
MRAGFLPGDELWAPVGVEAQYEVQVCLPRIQSIKVLDIGKRTELILDESELREQIAWGQLRVRRRGVMLAAPKTNRSPDEDAATLATLRMLSSLDSLRKQRQLSLNKAYITLREQLVAAQAPDLESLPSLSHVYRLWNENTKGLPVRKGNAKKGNRDPKHSDAVRKAVIDSAGLYLKTKSTWTLAATTEYINQQLQAPDWLRNNPDVKEKDRKVSKKYVQRVIREDLHADPEHARMDPQDAIAAKAVAGRTIRAEGLFERIEQDGLHLPWLVRTPYGDSTDVWLVHAIDCYTSMPVGWHLVIGAPRTTSTLACIETILFPKAPRLEALGLNYDFDIYGTPQQIVADNGAENKSDRILKLSRIGIDFVRLKSRHPHHKPFIERLNRSLKSYLQTLPGCTRFDGKDGQRDPAALGDPVMTIEELERWIVRFYFEYWANHPLERLEHSIFIDSENLGSTPLLRHRTLTEKLLRPMPLPISVDAWRSVVFDWHVLPLSRKSGITYDTFEFRGDRLPELIRKFGETEVTVLVDRDDFRVVYVLDADRETLIPLVNTAAVPSTPAYSFVDAKRMLEELRAENVDTGSEALRRDIFNRSAGVATATQKAPKPSKKSATKQASSKQTTKHAREHGAVLRSASNPLPPPEPALGHPPMAGAAERWASVPALAVLSRKPKKDGQ